MSLCPEGPRSPSFLRTSGLPNRTMFSEQAQHLVPEDVWVQMAWGLMSSFQTQLTARSQIYGAQ